MKNLIVALSLMITACAIQEDDKKLINNFINDFVLIEPPISNIYNLNSVIDIHNKYLESKDKKDFLFAYIQNQILFIKSKILENNQEYHIYHHEELEANNLQIKLKYDDYSSVYHLVCDYNIITSFIIKNNKIISFSYSLIKTKSQPLEPWLLNK